MNRAIDKTILLLNFGGPEHMADVRPYLRRMFSDPEILPIPNSFIRRIAAWMISAARYKKSQAMYAVIGGKSPIRHHTENQARLLAAELSMHGHHAKVRAAFLA